MSVVLVQLVILALWTSLAQAGFYRAAISSIHSSFRGMSRRFPLTTAAFRMSTRLRNDASRSYRPKEMELPEDFEKEA